MAISESVVIALDGWWIRLTRLWSLQPCNANQLMRPSDHIGSAVRAIATIAVLIAVPVAGALATDAYAGASAEIRYESATRSLVHAVITDQPVRTAAHRYEGRVRWEESGHTGEASCRSGRRRNSAIMSSCGSPPTARPPRNRATRTLRWWPGSR